MLLSKKEVKKTSPQGENICIGVEREVFIKNRDKKGYIREMCKW